MSHVVFQNVFFKPPLAIARIGGSNTPLDAFVWDSDKSIHGANRTVIRPAVTLKVLPDGSLRPYLPNAIQFRDGDNLRPVAPFFDLWATVKRNDGGCEERPLNLALLNEAGIWLDSVEYTVTVGNRKAQQRTKSAACAYIARINTIGDDQERKPLKAFSPHNANQEPLVYRDRPIPLGHFQVINCSERPRYLRPNMQMGTEAETPEALRQLNTIINSLGAAYDKAGRNLLEMSNPAIASARAAMDALLRIGESLAKFGTETKKQGNKSIGIPFFSRWDSQPASAGHPKP
jgi:hypothetical protein